MKNLKEILLKTKTSLYIADFSEFSSEEEFLDNIAEKLNSNIKIILLKMIYKTDLMVNLSRKIRQLCSFYEALFIIEDRVDIANLVDSDGIFLSENGFNTSDLDKIYDKNKIKCSSNNLDVDFILTEIDSNQDFKGIKFIQEDNSKTYKIKNQRKL